MICSLFDKIVQFLRLDVLAVFGVLQNIFFKCEFDHIFTPNGEDLRGKASAGAGFTKLS